MDVILSDGLIWIDLGDWGVYQIQLKLLSVRTPRYLRSQFLRSPPFGSWACGGSPKSDIDLGEWPEVPAELDDFGNGLPLRLFYRFLSLGITLVVHSLGFSGCLQSLTARILPRGAVTDRAPFVAFPIPYWLASSELRGAYGVLGGLPTLSNQSSNCIAGPSWQTGTRARGLSELRPLDVWVNCRSAVILGSDNSRPTTRAVHLIRSS